MYLGDNLLQGGIADLVAAFRSRQPDALILLTPVADPENYGVAELAAPRRPGGGGAASGEAARPETDLALVGVYMFTPKIHDAARAIEPSARGELEITDAIQHLVDGGLRVEPHIVRGLVEGHRPARGHARGQPPHARQHRGSGWRASWSTRRSTVVW